MKAIACLLLLACSAVLLAHASELELEDGVDFEMEGINYVKPGAAPAVWQINSNRFVATSFMGIAIGNVPAGTNLVCESYRTGQKKSADHEHATFCWGYVKSPAHYFSGWQGSSSCGYFPLIRQVGKVTQLAKRVPGAKLPKPYKPRCGPAPHDDRHGALSNTNLFMKGSYITGTGVGSTRPVVAGAKGCQLYLNYDHHTGKFRNPYKLAASGFKMGHRYNLKKGGVSFVKADGFDPTGGFKWFFIQSKCLVKLPPNNAPEKKF